MFCLKHWIPYLFKSLLFVSKILIINYCDFIILIIFYNLILLLLLFF